MNSSNNENPKTVLVLGATGGFGSALCPHMLKSGWQVRAVTRKSMPVADEVLSADEGYHAVANNANVQSHNEQRIDSQQKGTPDTIDWFVGNLDEPSSLREAAQGVDVIVHAVNVPYPKWNPLMINYTQTIIDLARENNAHLMFVGNIYNAGLPADGVITEHTTHTPINEKGQVRATLEDMLEDAAQSGLSTTIMRFGDFFGPGIPNSNWFDICTKGVSKNKLSLPGPATMPHTYAYLPDAVKAMEQVASRRLESNEHPSHMVLPFEGHVFSFEQLRTLIEDHTGEQMKVSAMPWWVFKLLGLVIPLMRDLTSMRYLWNHDIRMDGSALTQLLGSAPAHTSFAQAVFTTVPGLSNKRKQLRQLTE